MVNATLKGFVTRKEACERYDVSDRSIGRYLKKAMLKNDQAFLAHFKLITINGDTTDGADVTSELIDKLQAEGVIPTWLVSAAWLDRKYPLRNVTAAPTNDANATDQATESESRGVVTPLEPNAELLRLLKEQVQALHADKTRLEEEKKEMRIDARQTRELMNQMQQLMGHMQDRLLPEKTSPAATPAAATDTEVVDAPPAATPKARRPRKTKSKTSPRRPKPQPSIWKRDIRELFSVR